MAIIYLNSLIDAPPERVFDLSRSIDLHIISTRQTGEKAVNGVTRGLIELDETVTWQAFHVFKQRKFTSKITAFNRPLYFKDEMIKGDFKKFSHEHFFKDVNGKTAMSDTIILEAPFSFIGKLATRIFLKNYMAKLLQKRNDVIKQYAETLAWKTILIEKNG